MTKLVLPMIAVACLVSACGKKPEPAPAPAPAPAAATQPQAPEAPKDEKAAETKEEAKK